MRPQDSASWPVNPPLFFSTLLPPIRDPLRSGSSQVRYQLQLLTALEKVLFFVGVIMSLQQIFENNSVPEGQQLTLRHAVLPLCAYLLVPRWMKQPFARQSSNHLLQV